MLRNLSRTGYALLALSQDQGIILKIFLVRNRVKLSVSQRHSPTLNFEYYSPGISGGLKANYIETTGLRSIDSRGDSEP